MQKINAMLTPLACRHYFGVVPQETVLFSGTIYENEPHAASFSAG